MEFTVLEESKNRMEFTLKGETHTFCNLLKEALQNTQGVVLVSYVIDHPLVGVPQFLLETKSVEPRAALKKALASLKKDIAAFQKVAQKI